MNEEQYKATVNRLRLHGFSHEQAIMMAEAMRFALASKEFATTVGRFGIRHLEDALASMELT